MVKYYRHLYYKLLILLFNICDRQSTILAGFILLTFKYLKYLKLQIVPNSPMSKTDPTVVQAKHYLQQDDHPHFRGVFEASAKMAAES
jgi:hypothetical protein